jgi:exopolyphosphatase/guanosine-5'-triphosphate,3'-diphosphate pyrophosphatase
MPKIAAIDIGTNSVLYSLFRTIGRSQLRETHFERHSPRIGGNLKGKSNPLITEQNFTNLRKILTQNINHAKKSGASKILLAATNPFRLAKNAKEIKRRLDSDLGHNIQILSSDREAYLSFLGAVGKLRATQTAVLIDLGGGSTELVVYHGDKRIAFVSIPEGAVSLTERFRSSKKVKTEEFADFERYLSQYDKKAKRVQQYLKFGLTLVGGTSSALANLKEDDFLANQKEVTLSQNDLNMFVNILACLSLSCRRDLLAFDKKRAEIIFGGVFLLGYLFKILDIEKAKATPRGLRHGMALDILSR